MVALLGIMFGFLFFVPSLILSGILTTSFSGIFQKYIREKNERILLSLSRDVSSYIELQQNTLEIVSSIADFAQIRSQNFLDTLNRLVSRNSTISRIVIIGPENRVMLTSPWNLDLEDLDVSYQSYVRTARTAVGQHVSDVYLSPATGAPAIALSLTRPDGFIISMSIDILVLNTFIYSSQLEGREYSFLLDDMGTYIAHPNSAFVLEREGFEGWGELREGLRRNSGIVQYRELADRDLLTVEIPELSWVAGLSQPLAISRQDFNTVQNTSSAAIVGFMLACLALSILIAYRVSRPLNKLAQLAGNFAREETKLTLPNSMVWEVKQLTRSFSRMVSAVRQREGMLRELNSSLEQRVAQRTMALNESLETLRQAQGQLILNEKMAALGQLVAGVAHEMNTPLGVGVTAASALQDEIAVIRGEYNESGLRRSTLEAFLNSTSDLVDVLQANIERAVGIVAGLKQVAVDQQIAQVRQFLLLPYLRMVVATLRPELSKGSHSVELSGSEEVAVQIDPGHLSQIMSNLILNAVVHGFEDREGGTIRIHVSPEGEERVCIEVRDNGHGLQEAEAARIFDPFYTTRRGQGGTGLGLNIVYNLVSKNLEGTIGCFTDGEPGLGFRIVFPRVLSQGTAAQSKSELGE